MPKFFFEKTIKKVCSQKKQTKNEITALCYERVFKKLRFRKLFWKNENWTFLKCPKVKKSTESWKTKTHTFRNPR